VDAGAPDAGRPDAGPPNVDAGPLPVCWPSFDAGVTFASPPALTTGTNSPRSVEIADFNGDGIPDLVATTPGNSDTASGAIFWLGQGQGLFGFPLNLPTPTAPLATTTSDLNGDGLPDLAVGSCPPDAGGELNFFYGDKVKWLVAGGKAGLPACERVRLTSGDFLGSGEAQVAAASTTADGGQLQLFEADPDGGLSAAWSAPSPGAVAAIASADVNGDGSLDLIVGSSAGMTVYLGSGTGSFQALAPLALPAGAFPYSINAFVARDLDNDGKIDLAIPDYQNAQIDIFLGNGDGTFQAPSQTKTASTPLSIVAGDVDGDGLLDLIVGYSGIFDGVELFQNLGGGQMGPGLLFPAGGLALGIAAGDLLGNGLTSVAVASPNLSEIVVLGGSCAAAGGTPLDGGVFTEAVHEPLQTATFNGGPVLTSPQVVSISYDDDPNQSAYDTYDAWLPTSDWLAAVGKDYGVGLGSFVGSVHLATAPTSLDDSAIPGLLEAIVADGGVPPPSVTDGGVVSDVFYIFHFPASLGLTTGHGAEPACDAYGGYHTWETIGDVAYTYAVIPDCSAGLGFIQQATSHELIEASTDPITGTDPAYVILDPTNPFGFAGGEVGDLCEFNLPASEVDNGYTPQRIWSNSAAAAGLDPCIPSPAGPYFTVSASPTAVVDLMPGATTTFQITGWSTGPVPDWGLVAGQSGDLGLTISLDRATINNGQVANLTVTLPATASAGDSGEVLLYSGSDFSSNAVPVKLTVITSPPSADGGYVFGSGTPQTLDTGLGSPGYVAVSGGDLYWVDQGTNENDDTDGKVLTMPVGGGAVITLASAQTSPAMVAVSDGTVYWVNEGTAANGYEDGTLMSVPAGGGALTTLASAQNDPAGLAVSAGTLYWTTQGTADNLNMDGTLMAMSLSGGAQVTLASAQNQPQAVVVDQTSVYWTLAGTQARGYEDGAVLSQPLAGGTATTLAAAQNFPLGLAVDATSVYWITYYGGTIAKAPIGGGTVTTLALDPYTSAYIALDAQNVYWGSYDLRVDSVPINGGPIGVLAQNQASPVGIAVDASSVYWTDQNITGLTAGTLMSLTPK
jgi:hypothetical protein